MWVFTELIFRVSTFLENREILGDFTIVREMSAISVKIEEML